MALCFHHVLLYQPAHADHHSALQPWIDNGFLDLRSPFETVIDKKPLKAALRDFTSWGRFQEQADLAYLKTVGNNIAPVSPEIANIASEVKGREAHPKTADEAELSPQLFLHLAQEFDEHSWELREELSRVDNQYQALQGDFRQDQEGEAQYRTSVEPTRTGEEDLGRLMIDKRMAAWNRLFQRDPSNSGMLITDSSSAFDYLLADVEEKQKVLNFDITLTTNESHEKTAGYPSMAEDLQGIFEMVLTTPWSQALEEKVMDTGQEVAARIADARDSHVGPYDKIVSFVWYLVPDRPARVLFNQCCGVKTAQEEDVATEIKNTLVGLVQTS
ncbi:MAG: hypothetical protein JRJ47_04220 [Deltaproteobacteria bacterium]|nr:hypothetical protein [Deltaproteobacteria bacterium]